MMSHNLSKVLPALSRYIDDSTLNKVYNSHIIYMSFNLSICFMRNSCINCSVWAVYNVMNCWLADMFTQICCAYLP